MPKSISAILKIFCLETDLIVYLIQHGEAKTKDIDPERGLTDRGRSDIVKSAKIAGMLGIRPTRIHQSGKKRSIETAEILSDYLNPFNGVRVADGLDPQDDPTIWAKRLIVLHDEVMLVGHMPHLQQLSSLLLCGDTEREIISFKNSAIVSLELTRGKGWSINWIITPDMFDG